MRSVDISASAVVLPYSDSEPSVLTAATEEKQPFRDRRDLCCHGDPSPCHGEIAPLYKSDLLIMFKGAA
uniref:Uncharacterized protein n=1 Tax=Trichuris muris TaxID=70415 RepID=A0A5S6R2T0_TRIMR